MILLFNFLIDRKKMCFFFLKMFCKDTSNILFLQIIFSF